MYRTVFLSAFPMWQDSTQLFSKRISKRVLIKNNPLPHGPIKLTWLDKNTVCPVMSFDRILPRIEHFTNIQVYCPVCLIYIKNLTSCPSYLLWDLTCTNYFAKKNSKRVLIKKIKACQDCQFKWHDLTRSVCLSTHFTWQSRCSVCLVNRMSWTCQPSCLNWLDTWILFELFYKVVPLLSCHLLAISRVDIFLCLVSGLERQD